MKKALSLFLIIALCLSLCACGGNTKTDDSTAATETPPEIISVDTLFQDMTNEAKCTLNVGKQVTVLGQIQSIKAASCTIRLIDYPSKTITILMPIEILAKLSVDRFIAVSGVVESFAAFESRYTISATEPLDENATDTIFREIVAHKFNVGKCKYSSDFKESLHILYDYMSRRSSMYTIKNNEELKEYLCGTWDCGYFSRYFPGSINASTFDYFYITYNEDGSVKYSKLNSYRDDWEVSEDGSLQSFFGSKSVYILSDDVFLCNGYVFVRQK